MKSIFIAILGLAVSSTSFGRESSIQPQTIVKKLVQCGNIVIESIERPILEQTPSGEYADIGEKIYEAVIDDTKRASVTYDPNRNSYSFLVDDLKAEIQESLQLDDDRKFKKVLLLNNIRCPN